MSKRIVILTGGGDVPGLNAVIKQVTYRGAAMKLDVVGIRRGWEGLTHLNREDPESEKRYILPLTPMNTRTIDRTGGTFLHSSRTNPAKMKAIPDHLKGLTFPVKESEKDGKKFTTYDVTTQVLKNLESLGADTVIAIGGDDTLSYARRLHDEGVKVIAIPKTMDNDVQNTEYCIGFSTAITRAESAIQRQRTTVGSHERIGIFRIFGRDAGYTALYTAYVTNIRCCIPEFKVNLDKLISLLVADKRSNPSNYSLVLLSEGAEWEGYKTIHIGEADAYGHQKKMNVGDALAAEIKERAKEETIVSDLTYDLRSGDPDFTDKLVACTYGNMAMDALAEGQSGKMTGIVNGCFDMVEIPDPKLGPRKVDLGSMYNTDRYRPNYSNKRGLPIFLCRA
ncbi:MAG: 6-phosphofructokinase [Acidobacteria bacterium]|nr:6-phosphofructokinase [Acidobacteriota bacterium]